MTENALDRRRRKALEGKGSPERRVFADAGGLELREQNDGVIRLSGYAAVSNVPYRVGGSTGYTEVVAPKAFKRTLAELPDCVLLANHEGLPLARTRSARGGPGTLRLSEDDTGLRFEADMDALDTDAQQLARKIRRGDLSQCSMAFRVTDDEWDQEFQNRLLKSVSLHQGDVSVCGFGASSTTSVTVRVRAQPGQALSDWTTGARQWHDLAQLGLIVPVRRHRSVRAPSVASRERQQLDALRRKSR